MVIAALRQRHYWLALHIGYAYNTVINGIVIGHYFITPLMVIGGLLVITIGHIGY